MAIPNFNADGTYDLTTVAKRLAAAEAMLSNIAIIPTVYASRGPDWCRDEMRRCAEQGVLQLADAATCPHVDEEGHRCMLGRGHRPEVAHRFGGES